MPERFLLQILRDLTKQGILHSTRGGGGGFTLQREPEDVSLLDLVEAIDGPLSARLPINMGLPEESRIRLRKMLQEIADTTRRQLAAVKLTHLIEANREVEEPRSVGAPCTPVGNPGPGADVSTVAELVSHV